MTVTRIVVGLDGSDESRQALLWAIAEAAVWDAELDVVQALDLPFALIPPPINLAYHYEVDTLEKEAMARLDAEVTAATERSGATLGQVEKILVRDSAATALLETSRGADLVVVGGRGRGGFSGLRLGSVSNQCVHHAACPVVVVRGSDDMPRRGPILVGVDGSQCADEALRWAVADAAAKGRPVVALAAWSWLDQPGEFNPEYGAKDVQVMAETAVALARRAVRGGSDVGIEIRVVNDHAAPALIEASAAASLLVVGSRGLGGFRGLLLGSVSNKCVHHAPSPVVVVRGGTSVGGHDRDPAVITHESVTPNHSSGDLLNADLHPAVALTRRPRVHRGIGEGGDPRGITEMTRHATNEHAPSRLGDRVDLVRLEGDGSPLAEAIER